MAPALIPVLMKLGEAGYQMFKSQSQKRKAERLKQSNYTPPAVQQAIASAKGESSRMSAGYSRAFDKIKQSTAGTINMAKRIGGSSNDLQGAVATADAREKEALKDLEVNENAYQTSMRGELRNLQMIEGGYQAKSRDAYNATKSALIGAAEQNQYNAVTNAMEAGAYAISDKAMAGGTKPRPAVTAGNAAAVYGDAGSVGRGVATAARNVGEIVGGIPKTSGRSARMSMRELMAIGRKTYNY